MSKKLINLLVPLVILPVLFAATIVWREQRAASGYVLSEDAQAYRDTCQDHLVRSWRKDDDWFSYLTFMHYTASIRFCSCTVARVSRSRPDDFETAQTLYLYAMSSVHDTSEDRLAGVLALGEELGLSEAELTELVGLSVDEMKACSARR